MLDEVLAALPVDDDHRRITDAGEGVGDVGNAADGELGAVSVELDRPCPADVSLEIFVVAVHFLSLQLTREFAAGDFPIENVALQIRAGEMLAIGMKGDVVHSRLVAL